MVFTGVLPFNVEFFCDKCFLTVTGRFIYGYEYPVLPKQAELDAFHDDVDALRDDVERIAAKIARLQRARGAGA